MSDRPSHTAAGGTREETAMTDGERAERARQNSIIDHIFLAMDSLGGDVNDERRAGMRRMTVAELETLRGQVRGAESKREATDLIVQAIATSDERRRAAEYAADDGGPATVEM
jgi:hypothetical protein